MQTLEEIMYHLDSFYNKRESEHAKNNFQEILDVFCDQIEGEEIEAFIGEMVKIYLLLKGSDEKMHATAILSLILNVQLRPIVQKILGLPKVYFVSI